MTKKPLYIFIALLTILASISFEAPAYATSIGAGASQADTSAYQTQRLKINALLAERSAKFGQYDESLSSRSGIFGFQSKKDIKNSNEILRQIVLNDNNVFKELKILMDYKDMQVQQVQSTIITTSNQVESYKQSIKKLQDQNQSLKLEIKKQEESKNLMTYVVIFLIVVLVVLVYMYTRKISTSKS